MSASQPFSFFWARYVEIRQKGGVHVRNVVKALVLGFQRRESQPSVLWGPDCNSPVSPVIHQSHSLPSCMILFVCCIVLLWLPFLCRLILPVQRTGVRLWRRYGLEMGPEEPRRVPEAVIAVPRQAGNSATSCWPRMLGPWVCLSVKTGWNVVYGINLESFTWLTSTRDTTMSRPPFCSTWLHPLAIPNCCGRISQDQCGRHAMEPWIILPSWLMWAL